tara:strand:- start:497 stop:967 length:471 start_codon:yes stop_codon:yes gene_type:complete
MSISVELRWEEMWHGVHVGASRRIAVLKRGGRDRHGANPENIAWKADIEGACAELAVAKALGIEWPASVDQGSDPDLWPDIEVRRTNPSLIVRPNDYQDRKYVWVSGWAPKYEVVGWILGADAMNEKWLTDFNKPNRPKCYCVPRRMLCDIEKLKT